MVSKSVKRWMGGAACVLGVSVGSTAFAQAPGPDVTYRNFASTTNYGVIGSMRAYMFSSDTCNIGTQNLHWGGSWQGSPALAQNMYRIHDGRMIQLGMSWCKQACCAAAGAGCGTCNGTGGTLLGVGCNDSYSSSYNGGQTRLGPRSQHNAWTGAMTLAPTNTGDAIFKRLQVRDADMISTNFPGSVYVGEGVYVANDDAPVGNHYNNASWKRVTVDPATRNLTASATTMTVGEPAIYAWRRLGGPGATLDPSVNISVLDIPLEGRLYVASKATDLGGGQWRYDYAIYNLNSDRSAGSISIPVPPSANASNFGFSAPDYHSGEPYNNDDWSRTETSGVVTWATAQTFAINQNANAVRWGTMYNYWFTANAAPASGPGTISIGLFKPHSPQSVTTTGVVPGAVCTADFDNDEDVGTDADIMAFFACIGGNCCPTCNNADVNGDGTPGTDADIETFFRVLGGGAC